MSARPFSEWSEFEFGECACGVEAIGPNGYCGACFIERFEPDAPVAVPGETKDTPQL